MSTTTTVTSSRVTPAEVAACRARFEADARLAPTGHLRSMAAQEAAAMAAWSVDGKPVRSAYAIELARPTTPAEIDAAVAAWVAAEDSVRAQTEAATEADHQARITDSRCGACKRSGALGETADVHTLHLRSVGGRHLQFRLCAPCAVMAPAIMAEYDRATADGLREYIASVWNGRS